MEWELAFIKWANGWWESPILDYSLPWLTYLGSHIAVILFILLSLILIKKRGLLHHLLLLYAIQSGIVYGLKFLIQRQRPIFILNISSKLLSGPGEILDPSFPSAHGAYAFMMATILAYWFPRYRIIFFILAGFIGWTRIYLFLHYPTDVIAGGLLGYGISFLFVHILNFKQTVPESKRFL